MPARWTWASTRSPGCGGSARPIRPTPYVGHQALLDHGVPHGLGYYWRSEYVAALGDPLIATLAEHAWQAATPESYTIIFHLGGAVARQDPEGSAFEDRRAGHAVNVDAVWTDPDRAGACMAWTRSFWEARRGRTGRALKRTSDPTNVFRLNQNIRP